jgi:hypothetical protein
VAAKSAANRARLTLKAVVTLLTAGQDTALLLVLRHGDSGKLGGGVVLSSIVVNLVNRHGSVHDVWFNYLLVQDRLDGLVDVVVNVLSSDNGSSSGSLSGVDMFGSVLELGTLLSQTPLVLLGVVMVDLAVLDWDDVVVVLFRENLLVLDRLD